MKLLCVIPARFASVRFPGKPLAEIGGKPMIQWVYEAVLAAGVFDHVTVATEHEAIAERVRGFGGHFEMTSPAHPSGTDRVAEVANRLTTFDVVANVQGDQPFVTAEMLRALVAPFQRGENPEMATVGCPLPESNVNDPNTVKVLLDRRGYALYFSRSPIPYYRERHVAPVRFHLGLYAFQREFLLKYAKMEPTPLERCEQLEQLRVLENGHRIFVSEVAAPVLEVNTPEDLVRANVFVSTGMGKL